tara:strand:- start:647 stop:883 length:237 start_codon:yes stop_codon:yes gene_type:complete
MFSSNQKKEPEIELSKNSQTLDPLTLWLVRIACLLIILIFSGLLLGIPLVISLGKSLLNDSVLNLKESLRTFLEMALV